MNIFITKTNSFNQLQFFYWNYQNQKRIYYNLKLMKFL